jgi:hypothetical protein
LRQTHEHTAAGTTDGRLDKGIAMPYPLALGRSAAAALCLLLGTAAGAQPTADAHGARLDRLEAQVTAAEDVSALKKLQRIYGYYLDKGMWEDLSELYTDDAVTNYPAGVYIGKDSIRKHLYMS